MALPPALVLALAALFNRIERLDAPAKPSLELRALLAIVHAYSGGDRAGVDALWREMRKVWPGGDADVGHRRTHCRTAWLGLIRALRVAAPFDDVLHVVYGVAVRQRRRDEALRLPPATQAMVRDVVAGKWEHEIVATKGRPHSVTAQRMVDQRRAAGLTPAGEDLTTRIVPEPYTPRGIDPYAWAAADERTRKRLLREARG